MDANEFLNSKGLIYTRELININDERINLIELLNEYKALSQHDVIKNEVAVCDCPANMFAPIQICNAPNCKNRIC